MSYLAFESRPRARKRAGSLRSAYARWLVSNHGQAYRATLQRNRHRDQAQRFRSEFAEPSGPGSVPRVGILGGGFAGLFAGLILRSLDIECEVFEASERVGGRIYTWYSKDYDPKNENQAGLYGEVGGMRLPQFSEDMLPVQQLALSVNAVLARNGLSDGQVVWRKFYYSSPEQRQRFNAMKGPLTAQEASTSDLGFSERSGGNVPDVWFRSKRDSNGTSYTPINKVLDQINQPFLNAFERSFAEGFELLMQYDQFSMWDYLTTQFRLGDLGAYYDPEMGAKSDLLPWSVASYLETTNVGTGMYGVSFVEMVIAVYDWGGSKDPYRPEDPGVYMLTVDQGMQRFPDACRLALELDDTVTPEDGRNAQVAIGMLPNAQGTYTYNPPNLTPDAEPPSQSGTPKSRPKANQGHQAGRRERVLLGHKAVRLEHAPGLFDGHGGMHVELEHTDKKGKVRTVQRTYPYVISTLPMGAYLTGTERKPLVDGLSFEKATAIRECNYMSAFKAFLTFKRQFWTDFGPRQEGGYGAASTDRPNRQIIYPSYGYSAKEGVLQIYCWAADAKRLGALNDRERIVECLKGIQYLYPEVDVFEEFAGYDNERTTKTWFWDEHAGGGAFALFGPGQFKELYPTLLTPEFNGCLTFAGEAASVHHGWIVGALDSAYNAVLNVLYQAGADAEIKRLQETWGSYTAPDIADDTTTENILDYAFQYNEIDRKAASIAPGAKASIYGASDYVFEGNVPAFVADYERVPQSMKMTRKDNAVLQMLNNQWNDNVAVRTRQPPHPVRRDNAVQWLEDVYYGNNFQTIPAPRFWLKDDAEFARQQVAGFMPNLLTAVDADELHELRQSAGVGSGYDAALADVRYVADYRRYLSACTVVPDGYYLPKPLVFFKVTDGELMPAALQLEPGGELFTPDMPNAQNAWLLAKMLTNCAGQSLHDVGFHQLMTHQLCVLVSIAAFSEEVFNPERDGSGPAFQQHPVFRLLRPHLTKAIEFQQSIYNRDYTPNLPPFPNTRETSGAPGVYNLGFVYDEIFSCGRIGNYQLQSKIYDSPNFKFLDFAPGLDAQRRKISTTPFPYPYRDDASRWYDAMYGFVREFISVVYPHGNTQITADRQLQRFFGKLIPAFNYVDGTRTLERFPKEVCTVAMLQQVLTQFLWQFSVQHTVVNDGAYDMAAFVPNASTLMYAPPNTPSSSWTPNDVINCLPSQDATYPDLGGMTFMDVQINASVTGQGPYPETIFGRGVLEPELDVLQDTYGFVKPELRAAVENFYQASRRVGDAIRDRQARDVARYLQRNPTDGAVPPTVVFERLMPAQVMNTIQT